MEDDIADYTTQATDISDDIARYAEMGLLNRLLKDRSTGRNIIWASNVFVDKGDSYAPSDEILVSDITGDNAKLIRTRASKAREAQAALTRAHAEVFTPGWVVRRMIDEADAAWVTSHPDATWQDYVASPRLEITCGEAPYLVNRYDAADGTPIPVEERCGILDRKLRLVGMNTASQQSWAKWALVALRSTYGYEYQGDNLLIARTNVLATMEDFAAHAGYVLTSWAYKQLVYAISYNLWQMDGLTDMVPEREMTTPTSDIGMEVIPGIEEFILPAVDSTQLTDDDLGMKPARIYDWKRKAEIEFGMLKEEEAPMRFDYVIGNPPYQDETLGDNAGFAPPIYHRFLDESYKIGRVVELIHPARFLFNAGSTPKAWNKKMLADEHLKILLFEQEASKLFPGTDIKGGVAVSYHDEGSVLGPIGVFTPYPELNSIKNRVVGGDTFTPLSSVMSNQTKFDLDALYTDYPEYRNVIGSGGRDKRFRNNIFDKVSLFTENKTYEDDISVLGVVSNKRNWRYFPLRYVDKSHECLDKWKVLVVRVNGRGMLGETLSTPVLSRPGEGYTQTFIGVGAFDTELEAHNCMNYIKTKFLRALLGVLKITQDNSIATWGMIPLQDFTSTSDIDWSQSVDAIDQQLYKKYGLSQDEIDFIESHVKEMR